MMPRLLLPVLTAGFLTISFASSWAQEMGEMGPPEEMMQITGMAGEWDVEFRFRMDPTADWTVSACSATIENILDGSAQEMSFRGNMLGMEMLGRYLICYDRQTKKWQGVWVDNFAARISYSEGEMKDGMMVLEGLDKMEGRDVLVRITTFDITADRFDWKMEHSMDGGTNFVTSATAVYTRAGGGEESPEQGGR